VAHNCHMARPTEAESADHLIDLGEFAAGSGPGSGRGNSGPDSSTRADDPVRPSRAVALAVIAILTLTCLFADAARVSPRTVLTVPTARGDFQVAGDALYVFDGAYPANRVSAYGLREGRLLWRKTAPGGVAYADVTQVGSRTLLVPDPCASGHPVTTVAVDTRTGLEVWHRQGVPEQTIAGGRLIVLSRPGPTYGCGGAYPPSDQLPVHWDAIDTRTGAVRWTTEVPPLPRTAFDYYDGTAQRVVLVAGDGTTTSRDLVTGAVTGQITLPELAVAARPAGTAGSFDQATNPQLAVAGGAALVMRQIDPAGERSGLVEITAYDLVTLRRRWTATATVGPADPQGGNYVVVAGCGPMVCLYAPTATVLLDPRDGTVRWRTTQSLIAIEGDRALLAAQASGDPSAPAGLTVRDLRTGELRADLAGWPVFAGSRSYTGTPVLGFAARNRTWFARLDLGAARLTRAGSVAGLYYSCVGQDEYLACRRLDGVVRAWRVPGP
jgi:outer membrane protein assembly factor BamB